ncbi:hypothetical protein RUM44_006971 [Polyplax serrata]|uniref:Uncharacterized protein n=1 Tax=Polyplax serrata TaxID=468196 RepID=A0ABR1AZG2_POLSC
MGLLLSLSSLSIDVRSEINLVPSIHPAQSPEFGSERKRLDFTVAFVFFFFFTFNGFDSNGADTREPYESEQGVNCEVGSINFTSDGWKTGRVHHCRDASEVAEGGTGTKTGSDLKEIDSETFEHNGREQWVESKGRSPLPVVVSVYPMSVLWHCGSRDEMHVPSRKYLARGIKPVVPGNGWVALTAAVFLFFLRGRDEETLQFSAELILFLGLEVVLQENVCAAENAQD